MTTTTTTVDDLLRVDISSQLVGDNGTITPEDAARFQALICKHNESLSTVAFAFLTSFKRRCSWSIAVALTSIYEELYAEGGGASATTAVKKRLILIYLIFRVAELDGTDVCGAGIETLGHMFLPFLLKVADGEAFVREGDAAAAPEGVERWLAKMLLSSRAADLGPMTVDDVVAAAARGELEHENIDCDRVRRLYAYQSARFPPFDSGEGVMSGGGGEEEKAEEEEELDKVIRRLFAGKVLNMNENRCLLEALSESGSESGAAILAKFEQLSELEMTKLIEEHRRIATAVIFRIVERDRNKIYHYMEILMNMELSVQCIEAVVKLYDEPSLSIDREPLRAFVSHCLKFCDDLSSNPAKQSRLVRVVCLFVSSLLKKELLSVSALDSELSAFVLRHSQFRETTNLFQSLADARIRVSSSHASSQN